MDNDNNYDDLFWARNPDEDRDINDETEYIEFEEGSNLDGFTTRGDYYTGENYQSGEDDNLLPDKGINEAPPEDSKLGFSTNVEDFQDTTTGPESDFNDGLQSLPQELDLADEHVRGPFDYSQAVDWLEDTGLWWLSEWYYDATTGDYWIYVHDSP